jgi:TonB-linked SusC/RagA family outer membrane protein
MTRILSLFVVFMLTGVLAFSQNLTVTGKVTTADGTPVPFASITLQGSKATGIVGDDNGVFSLKAKKGDVYTLSGNGVNSKQITIGNQSSMVIVMERSNAELSTVVVTGLGLKAQSKAIGTSIVKVSSKELTATKNVNLATGLTGKVSGLNVQTVNSGVFGEVRITLRGIRSLTGNNQPMLILDGVPISLGYINSINPNDIQDVTILKSSSSTAIYGPDGVNGAILITSKKGVKGRSLVTLSHTVQFDRVSYMPKFQTQFGGGTTLDAFGNGTYDPIENQGYGDAFDGTLRQIGRNAPNGTKEMVTYEARPNEKKNFWATGITNQTDLSFSAGDFYMSGQVADIKGIMPKDENKRITLTMRSAREISEKLKVSFNANYTTQKYNVNAGNQFGNGRDFAPYWGVVNTPINIPITKYKDWKNDYFSSPDGYYNDYYSNPYWMVDNFREIGKSDDLFGNIEASYKITNWITATYRLGATVTSSSSQSTGGALTYSPFAKASGKSIAASGDLAAQVIDRSGSSNRLNSEIFLTARKEYKKFKFDFLVGQSYRETNTNNTRISSSNLGIPGVFNISVRKGEPGAAQSSTKTRLERYFGRASVGYNNWAFAEFTGSYDIDSRLANPYKYNPKDISFFYPGVNASLVLSEAIEALKGSKISLLKLRGAISKTGNVNLAAYSLENTYAPGVDFPFGTVLGFTSSNTLRQPNYKPEFVLNKEIGFEVAILKNKIGLDVSAYTQDNTNQLITVAYSSATGFPNALLNAASFTNKGLEIDLKLTPFLKLGNFNLDVKLNYTNQQNKVNSLIDGVDELSSGNGTYIIKGLPAYTFKLTDYKRDPQGRVIVDKVTGYPSLDPVIKTFGQTLPKHRIGLNLNGSFKNISFSSVLDYSTGNQIFSDLGSDIDFTGLSYRSGQNARQRFVFPNSVYEDAPGKFVANTNIYTQNGGYNFWSQGATNTNIDANYLASGAYLKLREVALQYAFPTSLFTGKGIKGATFSITGRNLFVWLPSSNEWTDPEFSNTTGNSIGVSDRNNPPPTRTIGANITLQF